MGVLLSPVGNLMVISMAQDMHNYTGFGMAEES